MPKKKSNGAAPRPYIEAAREHFDAKATRTAEVPEWGAPGTPLIVYFTPMTLYERDRIQRNGAKSDGAYLAAAVIEKALFEDGEKMFTIADKNFLMREVDPVVVGRLATKLTSAPTPEELEGN